MVTKINAKSEFPAYKAWKSAVKDWVFGCTSIYPKDLGPQAVRSVAQMTMDQKLYADLEDAGALGVREAGGAGAYWDKMLGTLSEMIHCSPAYLYASLAHMN